MARSMKTAARELAGEFSTGNAEQRAEQISRELSFEFPSATTRGRQRAAAEAAGAEIMTDAEMQREIEIADNKTPKRRAARAARRAGARARQGARKARGKVPRAASPFARAARPRDLLAQALGLIVVYWVIRTPDVIGLIGAGITRAFGWLQSTSGIGSGDDTGTNPLAALSPAQLAEWATRQRAAQDPWQLPPEDAAPLSESELDRIRRLAEEF